MARRLNSALALLLLAPLGACVMGPDYRTPPPPAPHATDAFVTPAPGISSAPPADRWWTLYADPALDRLVERALVANTDLRVAQANLLKARAVLRQTRALRLPDATVSGGASYGTDGGSKRGQQGGSAQWSENGAVVVDWEVDLFGRVARSIEAARADATAETAVRDRVALTVAAEVTRSYVNACALAESVAVGRSSVALAERQLTIETARERAGAASLLDRERIAADLATVRASLPPLEGQRQVALFELAALLGNAPADVPPEAQSCAHAPRAIAAIPVGDGRALLSRRPDIREAEQRLAADTARIGVAKAERFPRISLGGSGNFFHNDEVSGSEAFTWSVGPLISWSLPNLFVGTARVREAEAGAQASAARFDGTVLTALKEVEQALTLYATEGRRNDALREAVRHADTAYGLADTRYRAGAIALIDLLDTQRSLLNARAALADSDQQLGSRRVDLFKTLGGGWIAPTQPRGAPGGG